MKISHIAEHLSTCIWTCFDRCTTLFFWEFYSVSDTVIIKQCTHLIFTCLEQPGIVENIPAHAGGWNKMGFKVPSNANHSGILF